MLFRSQAPCPVSLRLPSLIGGRGTGGMRQGQAPSTNTETASSSRCQSSQGHKQKGLSHKESLGHSGAESSLPPRHTSEVREHRWRGNSYSHCPSNTVSSTIWDDTTTSHQETLGLGKSLLLGSIERDK